MSAELGREIMISGEKNRKIIDKPFNIAEEQFKTLFMTMVQGVVCQDNEGRIISANPAAEKILGIPLEEMLGLTLTNQLWHTVREDGTDFPGTENPAMVALKSREKVSDVVMGVYNMEEDRYRWVQVSAVPIFHKEDDTPYQVYSLIEDITKQRELNEEMAKKNKEFATVTDNLSDIIIRIDRKYGIVYVNKAIEKESGEQVEAILDQPNTRMGIPEQMIEKCDGAITFVFKTGELKIVEFSRTVFDNEKYYYARLIPEPDKKGKVQSVLAIIRDITENKTAEKRKDEFMSMASHELKTPITSIKAYTQILGKTLKSCGNKEAVRHIEKMEMQVNKLTSLICDLLDVSKIQQGKLDFKPEIFDFDKFLHEVIDNVQSTVSSHKILLDGAVNRILTADKDRLGQVMINLLTNAVKYSPKSEEIRINTESIDGHIQIQVVDHGIGIPENHRDHIFERFYRVNNTDGQLFPGLGIGLYISREIIKKYGGDILVDSEEGKGSKFTVILPLHNVI